MHINTQSISVAAMAVICGCAGPNAVRQEMRIDTPEARYTRDGERIKAGPVEYLRELKQRCDKLEQYRLTFYRQERLGLIPTLGPVEEIHASFRKQPFSVKFEWHDEKMPYYESVYVAGHNNNKLLIRERHGLFVFPPQVRILNLDDPVKLGKAKNPVTAFGLAQVSARTLEPFDDPKLRGVMTIRYEGLVDLEPFHRPAHHLRIERPPMKGYRYTVQDFYIDAETKLPAGTDLWLKNGKLDARYRYTDLDANVTLTDADFTLSKDHPQIADAHEN